jgi:NADH-quinone oxidoreductase subunit J
VSELAFYVLAVATVVAAAGVIVLRNPVHCAMSLVLALFLIAINFIMLDAHLVAALQIIVYAGAVMVLFLFVIMLLNLQADAGEPSSLGVKLLGVGAGAAVALFLSRVVASSRPPGARAPGEELASDFGTTEALARVLFRDHAVAFELTSVMLLVAVVGAVVLARRERA